MVLTTLSLGGEKKESLVVSKGCPGSGNRPDSLPPFMPVCTLREHNHAIIRMGLVWHTRKSMSAVAVLYLPFFLALEGRLL